MTPGGGWGGSGGTPWMSPQLIAMPTWKDTQPCTLTFRLKTIHQSGKLLAAKVLVPAPPCPPRVASEKSFKPWSHFIPIRFYWTINTNQPQCHKAALGLKAVGDKLYTLFTGHFSDCNREGFFGGSAVHFHTTLPQTKGTQLRRTIFLPQRSVLFHSWERGVALREAG